jgi:protein-S-isoprenylcysteine O-methyltransferase Ste14
MDKSTPHIVPPVYFLAAVIMMILLHLFAPIGYWLLSPWKYLGIVIIVLGFVLSLGSGNLFRRLGTPPRPGVRATVLVTTGAYRYTRNPMYLGLVTMLFGLAILLGSFTPPVVIPFVVWILHSKFIGREEKWMESWFGESYLAYKSKTSRWL